MLRGATTLKRPSEDAQDDRAAGASDAEPGVGPQRTALRGAEKAVAADDSAAPSKAQKTVRLVVTGFGRFHGVDDNPTQKLIAALQQEWIVTQQAPQAVDPSKCTLAVLEVSAEGSLATLQDLHTPTHTPTHTHAHTPTADVTADTHMCAPCLYVHLGVDTGAKEFHLESRAFNEAHFRCADERGHQPSHAPIDETQAARTEHALETTIDVDALVHHLRNVEKWDCQRSDDAGRFVCNWTYYQSLRLCAQRGSESHALFVHVPPEHVVPLPMQLDFIKSLLTHMCDTLASTASTNNHTDTHAHTHTDTHTRTPTHLLLRDRPAGVRYDIPPPTVSEADTGTSPAFEDAVTTIMGLGFDRPSAEAALEGVAGSRCLSTYDIEAAVTWIIDGGAAAGVDTVASTAAIRSTTYKLVLVVRGDLAMTTGKIAAQCCHGALASYQILCAEPQGIEFLSVWQSQGEPVIALRCPDLPTMLSLEQTSRELGLPTCVIQDAGRTQVEAGSATLLSIGPAPAQSIDQVTGHLKLL